MSTPFDLERFVEAQAPSYRSVVAELKAGDKRSHWMWFVFPQVAGLGSSPTAQRFGISGLPEARAYLAHPVLGPRLRECATALLALDSSDPVDVLNSGVDALKLRSSMTLFALAAPDEPLFQQVLDRFYGGEQDAATLRILRSR
jgi:uncharacterized protein (DUF1810 family)